METGEGQEAGRAVMDEKDLRVIRKTYEIEALKEELRQRDQLIANLTAQNTALRRTIVETSEALDGLIESELTTRALLDEIRKEINHQ